MNFCKRLPIGKGSLGRESVVARRTMQSRQWRRGTKFARNHSLLNPVSALQSRLPLLFLRLCSLLRIYEQYRSPCLDEAEALPLPRALGWEQSLDIFRKVVFFPWRVKKILLSLFSSKPYLSSLSLSLVSPLSLSLSHARARPRRDQAPPRCAKFPSSSREIRVLWAREKPREE